jgi:xylulokinase
MSPPGSSPRPPAGRPGSRREYRSGRAPATIWRRPSASGWSRERSVYCVSPEPTADASGVIAGFADATGRHLPLACTLNCTQAIDRVAALLAIDREQIADDTRVVFLPYLDGERTPDLPRAAGTILGLRHDTTREQILLAAYQGAVASLLEAVGLMADNGVAITGSSRIVLIGGGAQGRAWQHVVAALSGRPVSVPQPAEFVARGAAVQAAATLGDEGLDGIARRWARRIPRVEVEPVPRDDAALARIRSAVEAVGPLYAGAD